MMEKNYEAGRKPRLGTPKNPAVVQVQNKKRSKEIAAEFEKNGWSYEIQVHKDKPENIADLEILQQTTSTIVVSDEKPGRNDPCSCGSGKKYKKCCGS